MKRLFCTVVSSLDGSLDSPLIFHIKAETMAKAEERAREELCSYYEYKDEELDDIFETFTFEVGEVDIIEA